MPPEESPESKFDRLKKQLQDSILRDYPNPERKGCPGGAVLKELAERPLDRPVEDDPRWQTIDLDIPVPKYVTGTMIEIFKPDDEHRPASAGGSGRVSMITG